MQPPSLRRKFSPALLSAAGMKPSAAARKGAGNLSIFVVVFSIFIFGCFMYNEDIKSLAEFPFSPAPKSREKETTTVSVVMNARTVVETEIETRGADDDRKEDRVQAVSLKKEEEEEEEEDEEEIEIPPEDCDLFTGEWVWDNSTHPIYREEECEFLTAQVTCMRNGRKDSLYQNWRWQPRDCSLPK